MSKRKVLILSDAPTTTTGLGKITRELATRMSAMPEIEVATLGIGRFTSRHLPFHQYLISNLDGRDMIPPNLEDVCKDFFGGERGVLFTIMNPGWLTWLAFPEVLPECSLKRFLQSKPFETWAYLPMDAEGPLGKVPLEIATIIQKFDRILAYSGWQADMIERTLNIPCPNLPHGTDASIFYPRNKEEARNNFLSVVLGKDMPTMDKRIFLVGVTATNTPRKDWALAFHVCRILKDRGVRVGLWAHFDVLKKHWDIQALQVEYGLEGAVISTTRSLTDDEMARAYSACSVMLGIGNFEGWGLTMSEALACGVPVVHGRGGGGREFIPNEMLVDPIGYYNEGVYCHQRGCFKASDWADRTEHSSSLADGFSLLDARFYWSNCWPEWEQWIKDGL